MKSFSCKDVGVDCNKELTGQTDEEVMGKVETHAREDHKMESLDQDTRDRIKGAIHEVGERGEDKNIREDKDVEAA